MILASINEYQTARPCRNKQGIDGTLACCRQQCCHAHASVLYTLHVLGKLCSLFNVPLQIHESRLAAISATIKVHPQKYNA